MSWRNNYFNAIVFLGDGRALKYHKIKKTALAESNFHAMLRDNHPTARYVNYYESDNRVFVKRVYLRHIS